MNAITASAGLPFNPSVLRWAREWRGRSIEEAAKRTNVAEQKITAWEDGKANPTVKQARALADFYERPFLEFFLSRAPNVPEPKLAPDFRLYRQASDPRADRELKAVQIWAEETRQNALDLFTLTGEQIPLLPDNFHTTLETNPDWAASKAREFASFPIEQQTGLKSADRPKVIKKIRHAMERLGVLVLKDSALGKLGVRGLTLFESPLPVVIFGAEAPTAQAFTLAHELGHIALQQSAISGPPTARSATSHVARSEKWCDEFAGAFLVPASALGVLWAKPNEPQQEIEDDRLGQLANHFAISRHAMLIRLIQAGYVHERFYWEKKRPHFLAQEADYKGGGRSLYYGSRYRNALGDLYTGLVMDAWGSEKITNHNASEFMGTKSLTHLSDIRDYFFS